MNRLQKWLLVGAAVLGMSIQSANAQEKKLTLCWAAWDPANALVQLSKDFTAETGIAMDYVFVPWTSYAERMLLNLNSRGDLCDLLIGDSQWLGLAAESGHYVKLNDFFEREGISMDSFLPATVYYYSTWPKGSENYYALPAMGDAVGWVYRKDWFSRPEIRAEFKQQYGYELGVPESWDQLMDIGKFFQGRMIDGKKRYGIALYTERAAEGITMGATSAMYAWGFQYDDPENPYHMEGYTNGPKAVAALEFYKKLYECCTPPGHSNAYMVANLDAYKSGQTAIMMNFFAFFPGIAKDPNVGGEKSGFFVNPPQNTKGSTLGGQGISVVSYSDNKEAALKYIKWFAQPEVQKKWWKLGGYAVHRAVVEAPGFKQSTPFAGEFLKAMQHVRDFWQEPSYAALLNAMNERLHAYVVADQGTAQEALDKLVADWRRIFMLAGKEL